MSENNSLPPSKKQGLIWHIKLGDEATWSITKQDGSPPSIYQIGFPTQLFLRIIWNDDDRSCWWLGIKREPESYHTGSLVILAGPTKRIRKTKKLYAIRVEDSDYRKRGVCSEATVWQINTGCLITFRRETPQSEYDLTDTSEET